MTTKFLTNQKGKKIAAVIPIKEYEELMEDLEDLAAIASQRTEEFIPWEDAAKKLFPNGLPTKDLQKIQ